MRDWLASPEKEVVRFGEHGYKELPSDPHSTPLDLLDCLGCAALLVGQKALITGSNARARRLIGSDLVLRAGRLYATDRASDELLQDLLRSALSVPLLSSTVLLPPVAICRSEGRPIVVQVLPSSGLVGANGEHARALLLLTCLDAVPEVPESRLILLFRLTPAEARLAVRLGTGETLEEAADVLRVSLGTARNQLKAIFAKTGTNRQAELVALLWRVSDLAVSKALVPE